MTTAWGGAKEDLLYKVFPMPETLTAVVFAMHMLWYIFCKPPPQFWHMEVEAKEIFCWHFLPLS
jgi:hypothetical protein